MPSIHPAALERGAQTAGADSLDPAARPPPVLGVRALLRAQGLRGRRTPGLLGDAVQAGMGVGQGQWRRSRYGVGRLGPRESRFRVSPSRAGSDDSVFLKGC